jgi:Double zinc ribbon
MGNLTPIGAFATAVSVGTWIQLLIAIGVLALIYVATARIITQAGYSHLWILLPVAPLALTVICFFVFWHDLDTIVFGGTLGFIGITNVGFWWHLDEISIVLNIGFFVIFAFSRWPMSGGQPSPRTESPQSYEPLRAAPSGPASSLPAPPDPVVAPRGLPTSAAGPGAGPRAGAVPGPAVVTSAAVKKPSAQFCAWCGEALPGNRALFHDCGPRDRPETVCKSCGTAFPAGTSICNSCGAN